MSQRFTQWILVAELIGTAILMLAGPLLLFLVFWMGRPVASFHHFHSDRNGMFRRMNSVGNSVAQSAYGHAGSAGCAAHDGISIRSHSDRTDYKPAQKNHP